MAPTNRRDVALLISAKDQATKVFESAASALESLLAVNTKVGVSASKTGDRLADLAAGAAALDKAYAAISGQADRATQSFDRQQAKLSENREQLAALKAQAESAAAALQRLSTSNIQGPPTQRQVSELKGLVAEYDRLQGQQVKLASSVSSLEGSLASQRSTLQQVSSTAIAAADAQARLAAQIEIESQVMQQAAAAGQKLSNIQEQINKATGAGRQFSNSASAAAEILAEAAAHDKLILKLKEEQAAQNELAQSRAAQARAATLLPGSGIAGVGLSDGRINAKTSIFSDAENQQAAQFDQHVKDAAKHSAELDAAAANLRAQLNPLAAVEAKLNEQLAQTQHLFATGRISGTEFAVAMDRLKKSAAATSQALAAKGKPQLFGLTPYAVQNLSFQINDVFTQLASGTSLTQTIAQQGGQILQIFPKVGSSIIAAFKNPYVIAFAITLGTIVAAVKRLQDQADALRHFNSELSATAEGGTYSGKALAAAADDFHKFGINVADSIKAVDALQKGGVDPRLFDAFGKAAHDVAIVLGKEVPDAAKELVSAFTHGYDAVKKLDDEYDFLSAADRELIRNLFDQGKAVDARTLAFDIWSQKMHEAAENAEGPWSRAWRNLKNAFGSFIDFIANSRPIQFLNELLNKTGAAVEKVTGLLPGAQGAGGPRILPQGSTGSGGLQRGALQLTENDIVAIVKTAMVEAAAGNAQGQQDVASVVINRMIRSGEDAMKVVTAKNQFEGVGNDNSPTRFRFYNIDPSTQEFQKTLQALLPVLKGLDTTNGAVNFFAPKAQAALGRDVPAFANPARQTVARAGQSFFTGTFPGDKGLSGPTGGIGATTQASLKAGNDIINTLEKQLKVTEDLTDQERIRKAGLDAIRDAQDKSVNDPTQLARIQSLAELDAKRKIDIEKQAKARALEGELANDSLAAAKEGSQSLQQIMDAIDRKADVTRAKIEQARKEGVPAVNGQTLDDLKGQVDANTEIAKQLAVQKFYGDQLAALDKQRADAQQHISDQVKSGELTPTKGAEELQQLTDRLMPQYKAIADNAKQFKDSLGAAQINPQTQAFLDKASTAGSDAAGADAKASLGLLQQQYQQLNAAITERNDLVSTNNELEAQGVITAAELGEKNRAAYEGAAPSILAQIDAIRQLIELLHAQGAITEQVYQAWIAKIQLVQSQTSFVDKQMNQLANTLSNDFVNGAVSGLDNFAQGIAAGKNGLESLRDAFLQFASDFLREIAQMIAKQALFNALGMSPTGQGGASGIFGSILGSIFGSSLSSNAAASILANPLIFHQGGIAGQGSAPSRSVNAAWFQDAVRYHSGGIAGLAPNEVPAILQKGEEILTADDPRHAGNGTGRLPDIKVVNNFDPGDILSKALGTKVGEKVILNHFRENAGAFRSILGI